MIAVVGHRYCYVMNFTSPLLPLVTIAIPTYNRAKGYLQQALASARAQTYVNLEILVSDSASIDDTEQFVTAFADPRVRYHKHAANIGANNNFNFCVQQARGEYLVLLHDDDMIDSDFVECCVKAAGKHPTAGLIRTGTRVVDASGEVVSQFSNHAGGLPFDEFVLAWFAGKTAMYLCSTLFRTHLLQELGGFHSKHNLLQDVMAEVAIAARHGRADLADVKATFRIHEAEMSFASGIREWCEDSLLLLDLICSLAPQSEVILRRNGRRFFAKGSYYWASQTKRSIKRFHANLTVFRMYGYRYPPSLMGMPTRTGI